MSTFSLRVNRVFLMSGVLCLSAGANAVRGDRVATSLQFKETSHLLVSLTNRVCF